MKNLFYSLFVFLFCFSSAQEKYKFNMPEYDDVLMTSNAYNLPQNINFTKETFPKNLKKIVQTKNDSILNILEYDLNGNLLLKYYRQFVSENWNGKYLTIIERNKYDDKNRLVETIVLLSNLGVSLNKYKYDSVDNLTEILKTNIQAQGSNTNPWQYVENITSFHDFDMDENVLKVQSLKNYSKEQFIYDFEKKEVKNYFISDDEEFTVVPKEKTDYFLYKFDKNNHLISRTLIADNKEILNNSYKIRYKKNKIKKTEYKNNEIFSTTIISADGSIQTFQEIGKGDIKYTQIKKFKGKTLLQLINKDSNNIEEDREEYELDKYNLPIKMNFRSTNNSYSVEFKNDYSFY